jgi:hypothetical protein
MAADSRTAHRIDSDLEHLAELLLRRHGIPSMVNCSNDGFCADPAFRRPERPDEVAIGLLAAARSSEQEPAAE